SGLTFVIGAGDRIGVVAANGRGKSTFLKCLVGQADVGAGDITRSRGLTIGHVEQVIPARLMPLPFHDVVADGLTPEQRDTEFWRVEVALDSFEVPAELRGRPLAELSGGWRRLALIARASVAEPDMLLL